MSNRFHPKYHKSAHHTNAAAGFKDSGTDPIASPDHPFEGDFILNGALSAQALQSVSLENSDEYILTSNPSGTMQMGVSSIADLTQYSNTLVAPITGDISNLETDITSLSGYIDNNISDILEINTDITGLSGYIDTNITAITNLDTGKVSVSAYSDAIGIDSAAWADALEGLVRPIDHATTHALSGSDPLTPADIGAAPALTYSSVTTNTAKLALTGINPGHTVTITQEGNRIERFIGGSPASNANWIVDYDTTQCEFYNSLASPVTINGVTINNGESETLWLTPGQVVALANVPDTTTIGSTDINGAASGLLDWVSATAWAVNPDFLGEFNYLIVPYFPPRSNVNVEIG